MVDGFQHKLLDAEISNSYLRKTCQQMDRPSLEHGSRYPGSQINKCPCGRMVNSFNSHLARFPSSHLPGCPGNQSGHIDGCPGSFNTNWAKGHLANCPGGQRANWPVGHVIKCPIVQSANWSSGPSHGCNGIQKNCMPNIHAAGCETGQETIGHLIKCPCGQFFRPSYNELTRCPCGVTFKSTYSHVVSYPCSPAASHPGGHTFKCPTSHQSTMHPSGHGAVVRHPAPNACQKMHEGSMIPVKCTRSFPCETDPSDEDCSNDDESEELTEVEENVKYKSVLKNRTTHYLAVDKDGCVRDHKLTFQNAGCHDESVNPCHPLVTRKSLQHCPQTLENLADRASKGLLLYCTPVDFCIIDEQCSATCDSHTRHVPCDMTHSAKTTSQHSAANNHKENEHSKIVYETLRYQSADDEFRPKRRLYFNNCEEPKSSMVYVPVNKNESLQSGHCDTSNTKYSVQETIQLPAAEQNQDEHNTGDSGTPHADIFL